MTSPASVDGRRMAETGTGSVRSTTSAVRDSGDAQMNIAQKLQALGCPYPHSDIQASLWMLQYAHDNDLFKHSRELCDRFPELLKREAIR